MQRTFVLLKPDALNRGLVGKVIQRFEKKGLKLVALKMMALDDALLMEHYAHLADKPFFGGILEFMKSSPVVATVWEGNEAVNVVRAMCGVTNAREAAPGTVRGDYAMSIQNNVVHASDSEDNAKEEITRFFSEQELFGWKQIDEKYIYSKAEAGE